MTRIKYFFLFLIIISCSNLEKESTEELLVNHNYSLIPQPQSVEKNTAVFVINKKTIILSVPELEKEGQYLKKLIEASSNFQLEIVQTIPANSTNFIKLEFLKSKETPPAETYGLEIDNNKIAINGIDAAGIMRGIQTLRQLLPAAFHAQQKRSAWGVEGVVINDSPAFAWRGMLLDCCRHFFSKETIKKQIDLLAYYKMNVLHWHLTEDQGWRIYIEKYPKLIKYGAWRKESNGKSYGGYYTKEDIKEIVAYAQERHILVVPEIELPGHSQAAIAAYPHLSCTGEQLEVATKWGVFKDIYCAGNDSTFQFLEDVLTEVIELFPSPYIHIGGDECPKYRWEHCAKCQNRIKTEKLKNEHELQSYFIKRIAKFLDSKGKKIIGWDEILEGGLAENAVVQSWRGMDGALQAATQDHYAIASPTSHAYFDYKLDAIDLEKVYNFNPIPEGLAADKQRFILGGECNVWTEWIPTDTVLDNKIYPRLLAMAEVLWTNPAKRDYEDFYNRVQLQYPALEAMKVWYGAETIPIRLETFTSTSSINVKLQAGTPNLVLHYTIDGTIPSNKSEVYDAAIPLKKTTSFKVQAFKDGKPYGDLLERAFTKHLAVGLEPILSYQYSPYYEGGGLMGVTNGARGSSNFRDGNWQAVQKVPMEITIDLGEPKEISSLSTAFFQKQDSWIFLPTKVEFFVSDNGKNFNSVGTINNKISPQKDGEFIEHFTQQLDKKITTQYVKLKAHNITYCPDWHDASGSEAWLFVDEFVVE